MLIWNLENLENGDFFYMKLTIKTWKTWKIAYLDRSKTWKMAFWSLEKTGKHSLYIDEKPAKNIKNDQNDLEIEEGWSDVGLRDQSLKYVKCLYE